MRKQLACCHCGEKWGVGEQLEELKVPHDNRKDQETATMKGKRDVWVNDGR